MHQLDFNKEIFISYISPPHRDSIPGPSSPWPVTILTELSRPTLHWVSKLIITTNTVYYSVIGFAVSVESCNRTILHAFRCPLLTVLLWTCFLPVLASHSVLSCGLVFCRLDISFLLSVSGTCVLSHRQPAGPSRIIQPVSCVQSTTERALLAWGPEPVTPHYYRTLSCLPKYKPHFSV